MQPGVAAGTRPWHKGLLLLTTVAMGLVLFGLFRNAGYDDPFITYRYAANLRHGLGFVYNPGERVLSTTTPFYTLLLAVLSAPWPDLPTLSNLISTFSLAAGGALLYALGRINGTPRAGIVAGLVYPLFPLMIQTLGAETCFYTLLILAAFVLHARGRPGPALAAAGLATITRPDGVLVAITLGLSLLLADRRLPWRPLACFVLMATPWYLFAWLYFGAPLPVTLFAKQHQGQMAISQAFLPGFATIIQPYARQPLYAAHALLAAAGLWAAARGPRRWAPLLAWGLLYAASYSALGVSRYFWYYAPLAPVLAALIGLGFSAVADHFLRRDWQRTVATVVVVGLLLWPQLLGLERARTHPDSRLPAYRAIGIWLAAHTPLSATVGTLEVGIIGYYSDRKMIDFAGLIQPEVAAQFETTTTYEDAAVYAIQRYKPDYLVLRKGWLADRPALHLDTSCRAEPEAYDINGAAFVIARCQWDAL